MNINLINKQLERISFIIEQKGRRMLWLQAALYISFFLSGLAWMLYLCLQSPGTAVQDEIGHYLISKYAWIYPELILNVWGRTVNTMLYMTPALGGLLAARLFSILMAIITVLLTTAVAIKIEVRQIFWIPLFLMFQPWFADLSYAVITEVPFSLCLILGIYLWIQRLPSAAGAIFGLLPLIRHEGILLLGIWCLYALVSREWKGLLLSILPMLVYNVAYYLVYDDIFIAVYLRPESTYNFYGSGGWLHFVPYVISGAGFLVAGFAALSIHSIPKLGRNAGLFLLYAAYFVTHTIIYRFGLYRSGGYGLFLLPLAPGMALAAALGCEWASDRLSNLLQLRFGKSERSLISLFTLVLIVIALVIGFTSSPRLANKEQVACQQAAEWLHNRGYNTNQVVSTHVWFYYYFDLPLVDGTLWTQFHDLDEFHTGTIVVWDAHYSDRKYLPLSSLVDPSKGWQEIAEFQARTIILFQKQ